MSAHHGRGAPRASPASSATDRQSGDKIPNHSTDLVMLPTVSWWQVLGTTRLLQAAAASAGAAVTARTARILVGLDLDLPCCVDLPVIVAH